MVTWSRDAFGLYSPWPVHVSGHAVHVVESTIHLLGAAVTTAALSLAELEAFDPRAPAHSGERRFCCLLAACSDKRVDAVHRSLTVNMRTGAWHCHRCGESGLLMEWCRKQPAVARPFRRWRRVARGEPSRDDGRWRRGWAAAAPLAGTPGAGYLERRRIPTPVAVGSGVRYAADWYGRPAVLFAVVGESGRQVAVESRYTDAGEPKARSAGPKGQGVFAAAGAWDDADVALVEAPIDALSLAVERMPAIALCGVRIPRWLPERLAGRTVFVGLDADERGDKVADELIAILHVFGIGGRRFRPRGAKDWNELLQQGQLVRSIFAEEAG